MDYFYQNHNNQPTQNRREGETSGNNNAESPPKGRDEKGRESFSKQTPCYILISKGMMIDLILDNKINQEE